MKLTNKRPTIIHLPNGTTLGPGETLDVSAEESESLQKNPGMRVMLLAKYVTLSDGETAVEVKKTDAEVSAEVKAAAAKTRKLEMVSKATALEMLVGLATNEKDPDVIQAINDKANQITGSKQ